ncbi:MAG: hypothetical protein H6719_10575 [Sandaracinaceae bacterium]|nr:hypothetical protein [Sandaracinaceae bacterium]
MSEEGRGKRARVTLKFAAQRLALPGEDAELDDDESSELRLPSLEEVERARRPSTIPPREENDGGRDGWERQRRSVTPPPRAYDLPVAVAPPPALPVLDVAPGDALALVDHRSRPPVAGPTPLSEMADRFALGDFTAALRLAELVLGTDADSRQALETARISREKLAQLYGSRLGSLDRVPVPAVADSDVRWLGLDHRDGFVLSLVDGNHTIEEIIDVTGMSRLEVLKTLVELLDLGAIQFEG